VSPFGDLLIQLGSALGGGAGAPEAGVAVDVTAVDLTLPIEAIIGAGGELRASLPRGRMATGFQLPHGRVVARFGAQE
jgi:hypothetical protein